MALSLLLMTPAIAASPASNVTVNVTLGPLLPGSNLAIAGGTYEGGLAATGTSGQYCVINFTDGGGSQGQAEVPLPLGTVPLSIVNKGTGYTSAPTQATLGTGSTASCTQTGGSVSVSTTITDPLDLNGLIGTLTTSLDPVGVTYNPTTETYTGLKLSLTETVGPFPGATFSCTGATGVMTLNDASAGGNGTLNVSNCTFLFGPSPLASLTVTLAFPPGTIPAPLPLNFSAPLITSSDYSQIVYTCLLTSLCQAATNTTASLGVSGTLTTSCTSACPSETLTWPGSPGNLTFSVPVGGTPSPQSVTVSTGTYNMAYAVTATTTDGHRWLKVPGGGDTGATGSASFSVSIDATGLGAGTYTGSVMVYSSDTNTTQPTVGVTLTVTGQNHSIYSCASGSSVGILLTPGGGNVTVYVPKGDWGSTSTGIFVRNIEGTIGSTLSISTPNVVNSCSSNHTSGQTVCVANNTDVYLINGTTLSSTLTSGSNSFAGFSGGSCQNCGVVVDAVHNTAVINMGLTGGASGDGVQILSLKGTPTFDAPFPIHEAVSENIAVDALHDFVLSANEGENYVLLRNLGSGALREFDSTFVTSAESDSSAEDCSTGIAIAPGEFTNNVFLMDLKQAKFSPGSPGTYTAPNQNFTLVTDYDFSAGLSGSAVAQGSSHLGIVTGEFGGDTAAVIQLPATAGSGTPTVVDYATFQIPSSTACGGTFSAGFDPHGVTAYTSPNNGKPYAVFVGYGSGAPICLAVVDMQVVMAAPRGGSGFAPHDVAPGDLPASAVTFFAL